MGIAQTTGWGIPGSTAHAWIVIENLGNAQETDTGITYGNTAWGNGISLASPIGNPITSISLDWRITNFITRNCCSFNYTIG